VRTDFEALNLYVYHSVVNVFLDGVIWCLGPYADPTREYEYGLVRHLLGRATRRFCGVILGLLESLRHTSREERA